MSDYDDGTNNDDGGNETYTPVIGWTASQNTISVYFLLFLSLLALVLVLSSKLHHSKWLASILPEAGLIIIVGIAAGAFFSIFGENNGGDDDYDDDINNGGGAVVDGLLSFSPKVFFVGLLPPIIFNSGYHIKRELFFRHIVAIFLYACIGTVISTGIVALFMEMMVRSNLTGGFKPSLTESLTFGALISATDPVSTLAVFQMKRVDPQLFYLVFGESVMNDAVGLVLFDALAKFVGHEQTIGKDAVAVVAFFIDFGYIFVGSLVLGIVSGAVVAYLLKVVDMRETRLLELSLYVLFIYLPFFAAETLRLSGIVTILFTGISAKRYAEPNLSDSTKDDADCLFRVIAHLAESAIFLELGLSLFGIPSGVTHVKFIFWAFIACLLGRALNVYPISILHNRFLGSSQPATFGSNEVRLVSDESRILAEKKVDMKTSHMLWFSGLRGAVAYACAKTFPDALGNRASFVSITMWIILLTVFLLGSTTDFALKSLGIETDIDEDKYLKERPSADASFRFLNKIDRYICPLTIRDFKSSPRLSTQSIVEMNTVGEGDRHNDGDIEISESFHLDASNMEGYYTPDGYAIKEKGSLYDFGGSPGTRTTMSS